jgi:phospholipid/cholesterol/gamma-HCH transport system ATP-binding protein
VVNRFGAQVVHDGVSFDVCKGEIFGIVGGSGSGKSVLLRTILGLRRPDAGTVLVEGRDVTCMQPEELREVKRRYGVAFQHGALFSSLSVENNLTLPVAETMDLRED